MISIWFKTYSRNLSHQNHVFVTCMQICMNMCETKPFLNSFIYWCVAKCAMFETCCGVFLSIENCVRLSWVPLCEAESDFQNCGGFGFSSPGLETHQLVYLVLWSHCHGSPILSVGYSWKYIYTHMNCEAQGKEKGMGKEWIALFYQYFNTHLTSSNTLTIDAIRTIKIIQ